MCAVIPSHTCRWLYQIFTYFFFFFNVIFGFVMCVLRVLGVVIFTVVMLFRLDWDVYMRGLEGWDMGMWCTLTLNSHTIYMEENEFH